MNKFYALIIMADNKLCRMWVDNNIVMNILKSHSDYKVYRCATDQEAILQEDSIVWKDVATAEELK